MKILKYVVRLITAALFFLSMFPANAAISKFETQRPDGSLIHWSLDLPKNRREKVGLVVIMQGSGCQPTEQNRSLALTRKVFPEFASLRVDKYGVNLTGYVEGDDEKQNCPQEYYTKSTFSQRVADYLQILNSLSSADWWNRQLIIIGGSEGGDIAAQVAAQTHPQAVVLISTGGGATFGEIVRSSILREMEQNKVPRTQWPDIDGVFAHAQKNPQSAEMAIGYSYKYWADAIDYRAVDDILKIAAPILLIHGTSDTSVPLYTARAAVDTITKAKRCNVTYWEKVGYSHGMVDPAGNHRLKEVLQEVRFWVKSQLEQRVPLAWCYQQKR